MDYALLINRRRLLDTFLDLVNINSPSFQEREIGLYIARRLEAVGCRVVFQEYDRSFNLIGVKEGADGRRGPLLLSAHMDTVEPTEGIRIEEDGEMVRSAGATVLGADDKSAIAQIIEALEVIHARGLPHGYIEIALTSAEEKGLCGARNLDPGMLRSRQAIVLDSGGSVGSIIVGAPTHVTYEMRITGRAAHAGLEPEKGLSAISVSADIIRALPDGRIDPVTTANIGIINGGTATNVVAKEVVINGEIRSHDAGVLAGTKDTIFRLAREIAAGRGAGLEVHEHEEYRTFRIPDDEPFVRFIGEAMKRSGIASRLAITGGGSDANVFNQRGILAVNISTGMQNVHSTGEFILKKDLYHGCLVLLECLAGEPWSVPG
ncbi:MAG: M20/M25/M40 family metallo-hydrolase [Nitrospiraceae bacterium]|nr:M20/M25/M40 family metallo-hydrolase [Nitrospiraceae bacterium]